MKLHWKHTWEINYCFIIVMVKWNLLGQDLKDMLKKLQSEWRECLCKHKYTGEKNEGIEK